MCTDDTGADNILQVLLAQSILINPLERAKGYAAHNTVNVCFFYLFAIKISYLKCLLSNIC